MEVAVGILRMLGSAVLETLKESLQLRGAQGLSLERATSTETPLEPELQLNMCMLSELFLQILAAGLGALALVWATVVLLGGFSTSLQAADFWVITAIVFIQTARVVGINLSPEAEFFNQVPLAFLELGNKQYATWGRRTSLTGKTTQQKILHYLTLALSIAMDYTTIALLAILVLAVPVIAGLGCISLSIYRLVALLSRHPDNSNVLRALIFFYALVLVQGGLFIIWFRQRMKRTYLAKRVSLEYGFEDKRELIDKYMNKTLSTAIKNGVSSTINRNLASFAADLIKSDYRQDHIDAVLVIHTLISKEVHRRRILSQIQSSPLCVSRLLDMVTSKSRTDHKTKICIADIVAHLASNLRLADISGATESISSMLDPYFTKISTPATSVSIDHQTAIGITIDQQGAIPSVSTTRGLARQRELASQRAVIIRNRKQDQENLRSSSTSKAENKPLISHGLLILAKLAVNPDNCKQIYDSKGLFSKIIMLVKYKVYKIPSYDGITMEIAENALEVVSTLISGTDETNRKIRRDICSNGIAVNDIRPILERDNRYNKLKVPATKILTELYLDMSTRATIGLTAEFIEVLLTIFFDAVDDSELGKAAGEALAVLAMDNANCTMIMNFSTGTETSVVQLLTAMIPEANNRLYKTAIAQLLTQFFANSDPSAERKGLKSVKTILHEVLKVICNVEQAENSNQASSPQHNPASLLLPRTPGLLKSLFGPGFSLAAKRNAPADSLLDVAQPVDGRKKSLTSLAAFLGLAMQISDKLKISADDFDIALANIPLSMGEFVDKLNDIIKQSKGHSVDNLEGEGPSVEYLIIIKTVTKLCTWMMQSKPDCISEFQNRNTSTKLQGALEDMRGLELGMLLTGSAEDMADYKTLSTIVAEARLKMDANVLVSG